MVRLSTAQSRKALGICCVYVVVTVVGLVLWQYSVAYAVFYAVFSGIWVLLAAYIGLTLAEDLDFEPLPLVTNLKDVKKVGKWIGFTVIAFLLIFGAYKGISMAAHHISTNILGETFPSESFFETHYPGASPFAAFFLIFASAGIMGEVFFRLFALNLIWKLTKNAGIAIVVSSVIFSIYFLTPLNPKNEIMWGFPFYHLVVNTFAGIFLGYAYKKLGFESVVVVRTLMTFFG
ncbi:MAG: CPBP family intramembrane metalloprotease [Theionarchaea archaeon]|nr:CPBP family intramembrane metalloprotease [Theionarchaea archaeon]